MKLLIAVPSKGRADSIIKRTMRWLPRVGFDVRVFVEPQEFDKYKERLEHGNYDNRVYFDTEKHLIDIGENDKGLSFVKGYIKQYALENGYDLVFKMDDDVLRFNARGKNKPDDEMVMDFAGMVGICRKTMGEYPDVGAIGFGYRNELFNPKRWVSMNSRLQTCYIIRTELLQNGFNTTEDFAQYLYIRSLNKVTLRYGMLGIDCADVGKNKGGLQMFDRSKQFDEEVDKLKEIYPALQFKKVEGKDWQYEPVLTGDFFGVKKL